MKAASSNDMISDFVSKISDNFDIICGLTAQIHFYMAGTTMQP